MDFTPIIDGVITVFPQVSPYLAIIPTINIVAVLLERATRRSHSTQLNTVMRWLSSFPGAPRAHPEVNGAQKGALQLPTR